MPPSCTTSRSASSNEHLKFQERPKARKAKSLTISYREILRPQNPRKSPSRIYPHRFEQKRDYERQMSSSSSIFCTRQEIPRHHMRTKWSLDSKSFKPLCMQYSRERDSGLRTLDLGRRVTVRMVEQEEDAKCLDVMLLIMVTVNTLPRTELDVLFLSEEFRLSLF